MRFCFHCGGDADEPAHVLRCDGQQGAVEAEFNRAASRAARDQALAVVEAHAAPGFVDVGAEAAHAVARRQRLQTTDDVWRELGHEAPTTHDRRAMGAVMRRAQALGYIVPEPTVAQSVMVSCHSRPKRVWRSLVYRAEGA